MITWCRKCDTFPVPITWKTRRRPKCGFCVEREDERRRFEEAFALVLRRGTGDNIIRSEN